METLIFLDFETTGLPEDCPNDPLFNGNKCRETPKDRTIRLERILLTDGTTKMPKLTELSLLSIPRALFSAAAKRLEVTQIHHQFPAQDAESRSLPVSVVANVHTRQLNPQMSQHDWAKYEESRQRTPNCIQLKKCDLEWKATFSQEWPGVHQMLQTAPKPACLIAHNGLNFDFRLLWHELKRANLLAKYPIPDNIFFVDSLHAFLDIETEYNAQIETTTRHIDWPLVFSQTSTQSLATDQHLQLDSIETTEETSSIVGSSSLDLDATLRRTTSLERLQRTPEKKEEQDKTAAIARPSAKRALFTVETCTASNPHPVQFMRRGNWSPAKRRRINPDLFVRNCQGEWNFNWHAANRELFTRGNFRLDALYNRLFSTPFQYHRAQADCEALLQICLTYGDDFLNYLDRNHSTFPQCYRNVSS